MDFFSKDYFRALPIADLLTQIVSFNGVAFENKDSLPVMTLVLRSGANLKGFPLQLSKNVDRAVVVLLVGNNSNGIDQNSEVIFIDLNEISVLGFSKITDYNQIFRKDEIDRQKKAPPLSKLDARRKLEALKSENLFYKMLDIQISQFSNDEKEWGFLAGFAEVLVSCLNELSKDELGAKAISPIKSVEIHKSTDNSFKIEVANNKLNCFIDFNSRDLFDSVKLTEMIEAKL